MIFEAQFFAPFFIYMPFNYLSPIRYKDPLFRPPSEAGSLIFQVSYGCPHNKCLFCPMYKGTKYEVRPLNVVLDEIDRAAKHYRKESRIFLSDGDVMNLDYPYLKTLFEKLNSSFPKLARISMYANGSSINRKNAEELKELKALKLYTLYMGLETGDEDLLKLVKKGETAQEMTDSVIKAQEAGIRMCVFALLGLGGAKYSKSHAELTAKTINQMSPKFFAVLRFIKAPGTKMYDDYQTISEYGSIEELHSIIKNLDLTSTIFRADHTSVPIPLSARFPKNKETLINYLESLLNNSSLDRHSEGIIPDSL